jgi:hypothetical protein
VKRSSSSSSSTSSSTSSSSTSSSTSSSSTSSSTRSCSTSSSSTSSSRPPKKRRVTFSTQLPTTPTISHMGKISQMFNDFRNPKSFSHFRSEPEFKKNPLIVYRRQLLEAKKILFPSSSSSSSSSYKNPSLQSVLNYYNCKHAFNKLLEIL